MACYAEVVVRGHAHLLLALLLATSAASARPAHPRIVLLGPTSSDAGHVPRGQPLEFVVRVRNEGDAVLEITPPEPRVVNQLPPPSPTRVMPGEEHGLRVTADTRFRSGPIDMRWRWKTNDSAMRTVIMELRAVVDPFVEILPSEHAEIKRFHDEEKPVTLTIRSHEPGELVVRDVRSRGRLGHELKRLNASEYELQVWVMGGTPPGWGRDELTIVTNSAHEPERDVRVEYTIRGRLQVAGDLTFPATEMRPPGQDDVTRVLTVTHVDGKAFSLVNADVLPGREGEPDPRVEATWECAELSCRVSVVQRGGLGDAGFTGTLMLTSSLPGEPPLAIPLHVGGKCRPRFLKHHVRLPCPTPLR